MSTKPRVQAIIEAAELLTPLEQLDLIGALSQALHRSYLPNPLAEDFWKPRTLEQHLQTQPTRPIVDIKALRASFWPEDESTDDLLRYIYEQRHPDRQQDGQ